MNREASRRPSLSSWRQYLAEVATREDRVCVLNILGGESRQVTPIGHAFSGGNVVFGTSPGRSGQALKTALGEIPVFNAFARGSMPDSRSIPASSICRPPVFVTASPNSSASIPSYSRKSSSLRRRFPFMMRGKFARLDKTPASTFSAAIASAWPTAGTAFGLAARSVATSPRIAAAWFSRNLLQFGRIHHDHRAISGNAWLGHDDADLLRQRRLYQLRRKRFRDAFDNDERSKAAVLYAEPGGYYEHNLHFTNP